MAGLFHIRDHIRKYVRSRENLKSFSVICRNDVIFLILMVLLTNNFNNKNIYYDLLQGMSEGQ